MATASKRRAELRFCVVFAVLTLAIFAALYLAHDPVVVPLNQHIAWLAGAIMRGLGADAVAAGAVLRAPGFAVEIKNNCNAIYELGLYAAAVWAYPASLGAKMAGTLIGAGVLNLVNLLRVVTLVALGIFAHEWFDLAHLYVWQAAFFAVVALCWFGWVLRVSPRA
ncbi:MAG: exosortase H [Candidatus Rokuibacteriota bacterium]